MVLARSLFSKRREFLSLTTLLTLLLNSRSVKTISNNSPRFFFSSSPISLSSNEPFSLHMLTMSSSLNLRSKVAISSKKTRSNFSDGPSSSIRAESLCSLSTSSLIPDKTFAASMLSELTEIVTTYMSSWLENCSMIFSIGLLSEVSDSSGIGITSNAFCVSSPLIRNFTHTSYVYSDSTCSVPWFLVRHISRQLLLIAAVTCFQCIF